MKRTVSSGNGGGKKVRYGDDESYETRCVDVFVDCLWCEFPLS